MGGRKQFESFIIDVATIMKTHALWSPTSYENLWTSLYIVLLSWTLTEAWNFRIPEVPYKRWEWVASSIIQSSGQTVYDVQIICENITCTSNEFLKEIQVPILLSKLRHRENSYVFIIPQNLPFVASVLESAAKATLSKYVVFVECVKCVPVEWIIEKYWQHRILDVAVILSEHEAIPVFTYFPFREGTCFDRSPVLLGNISHSKSLLLDTRLFPKHKVWNLQNCTLTVSSFKFPGIYFEGGKIKGSFSIVFNAVAKSMNFNAEFIHTDGKNWYGSASGPQKNGIRGDVFTGLAHLGFGFIQAVDGAFIDFDGLALPGCLTWCVAGTYKTKSVWWYLLGEYSYSVWMLLFLSGMTIIGIDFVSKKIMSRQWLQGDISLAQILWALFLQVPITLPRHSSVSFRLLWISCLLPSLVLSTAYLSTLKSLRTASHKEYAVKNLRDLANTGIQVWYFKGLESVVIDASSSNPDVAKLLSNSVAFAAQMTTNMFKMFGYKNISVLMLDKFCRVSRELYLDKKDFEVYPLPQGCMRTSAWNLFVMAKKSVFSEAVRIRVAQLTQAGIVQIIAKENGSISKTADIEAKKITLRDIFPVLLLLSCGLSMSVVAFIVEMLLPIVVHRKSVLEQGRRTRGAIASMMPQSVA